MCTRSMYVTMYINQTILLICLTRSKCEFSTYSFLYTVTITHDMEECYLQHFACNDRLRIRRLSCYDFDL
jgi:hypothetical protein